MNNSNDYLKSIVSILLRIENKIDFLSYNKNEEKEDKKADKSNKNILNVIKGETGSKEILSLNKEIVKKLDNIISILKERKKVSLDIGLDIKKFNKDDGNNLIEFLKDFYKLHDKLKEEKINLIGKSLYAISLGIKTLTESFSFSKIIALKLGKNVFINTIEGIINIFDKLKDTEKLKSASESFNIIASSLINFAKGLALATLASVAALPFQPIIIATLFGYIKLFSHIGKKQEDIISGIEAIKNISKSFLILSGGIAILTLTFITLGELFGGGSVIAGVTGTILMLSAIAGVIALYGNSNVKKGIETIKDVSKSFLYLAGGIAVITLVFVSMAELFGWDDLSVGIGIFVGAMAAIAGVIALYNFPLIKKGAETIKDVSKSFLYLAGGIAVMTLVFASMVELFGWDDLLVGIGSFVGAIAAIGGVFILFSLEYVKRGVKTVKDIGKSFLYLAGGIAILALTFTIIGKLFNFSDILEGVGAMMATVVGIGISFVVIGSMEKIISRGVKVFRDIGIGFLFLSLGVLILTIGFSIASGVFGISPLEIGGAITLVILGFGYAFSQMGHISKNVLKGAFAMILISVSFILFAFGLSMLVDPIEKLSWEGLGKLGVIIAGLTGVYVGLSFAFPYVIIGIGVLAAISISLISLGIGLKKWTEIVEKDININKLKETINNLLDVFFEISLSSMFISSSIKSVKLIGEVLSSLAEGVASWVNLENIRVIKGYNKDGKPIYGEKVNIKEVIKNISLIFGSGNEKFNILQPFIDLSNKANLSNNTSLLSLLIGTDFGKSPFEKGISIVGQIGKVLSSLAMGIATWATLTKIPIITGYDKNGNPIYGEYVNVSNAINNLKLFLETNLLELFVSIAEKIGDDGILGILSSIGIKSFNQTSKIRTGIKIMGEIGLALSSLAEGLKTFADLENIKIIDGYDKNGKPIYSKDNVKFNTILTNVQSAISGIFEKVLELSQKYTRKEIRKVDRMMDALDPLGSLLSGIAESMKTFADLENIKVINGYDKDGKPIYGEEKIEFSTILTNVQSVISGIFEKVLELSKKYTKKEIKKAGKFTNALDPIGPLLGGLADSLSIFADLKNIKVIKGYKENGEPEYETLNIDNIITNIENAIDKILIKFMDISLQFQSGKYEDLDSSSLETITNTFNVIIDPLTKLSDIFSKLKELSENEFISYRIGIINFIDDIFNSILSFKNIPENEILKFSTLLFGIKEFLKIFEDNKRAESFNIMEKVINVFDKFPIIIKEKYNDIIINRLNQFSNILITTISKYNEMERFSKGFNNMAKAMDNFVNSFNKMSPESIETYNKFTETLHKFITLDINEFERKLKLISESFGDGKSRDDNNTKESGPAIKVADNVNNSGLTKIMQGVDDNNKKSKEKEEYNNKLISKKLSEMILLLSDLKITINGINNLLLTRLKKE